MKKKQSFGEYIVVRQINKNDRGVEMYEVKLKSVKRKRFALKLIPVNAHTKEDIQKAKLDIRILSSINHPFIVEYVDSFVIQGKKGLQFW